MKIIHLAKVGSTNDEVSRLAQSGEALPFWVIADEQTDGRGRRGRSWQSLEGNLFASGIYDFKQDPAKLSTLSFVASYSLFEVLCEYIDISRIALKWPNDILVDEKKISGILLESQITNQFTRLIIGVGLNVFSCPNIDEYGTTSIIESAINRQKCPDNLIIFKNFLQKFEKNLSHWENYGSEYIIAKWKKYAFKLNKQIEIVYGNKNIIGEMLDIAPNGEIILRDLKGDIIQINAGEILF